MTFYVIPFNANVDIVEPEGVPKVGMSMERGIGPRPPPHG